MSTPKHTPGPWIFKAGSIAPAICAKTELGSRQIASMTVYNREEQTANARLIAAAPELLEALAQTLQLLREQKRTAGMYVSRPFVEEQELNETIGKAERALDKARGES